MSGGKSLKGFTWKEATSTENFGGKSPAHMREIMEKQKFLFVTYFIIKTLWLYSTLGSPILLYSKLTHYLLINIER